MADINLITTCNVEKSQLQSNEEGKCPYCGSEDITYGSLELEGSNIYYPATCDDCGTEYQEHYTVQFHTNDNIYVEE